MFGLILGLFGATIAAIASSLQTDGGGSGDPAKPEEKPSGDPAQGNGEGDPKPDPAQSEADKALAEAGRKAIDVEREARQKAERELAKVQKQNADLAKAQMTEQEKAVAEAKEVGRAEARKEMLAVLAATEVRARGAGKIGLSADRMPFLFDLNEFVDEAGNTVDTAKIDAAIEKLLKDEPTLAAKVSADRSGPDNAPNGSAPTEPPVERQGFMHFAKKELSKKGP